MLADDIADIRRCTLADCDSTLRIGVVRESIAISCARSRDCLASFALLRRLGERE